MGCDRRILGALMGVMGLLGGCAGFGENFRTDQVSWAGQPGDRTLAVQVTGDDGLHQDLSCASTDADVLLMPDTKYYRDYLQVDLSQAGFRGKVDKKAEPFIRHPSRSNGCRFVFEHLPAGNWLLVTRPQFSAHDDDAVRQGKNPQQDVAPPVFMWNAVSVPADTGLTALEVEKDLSRIVRKKHKHVHKHVSKHSRKRRREFRGAGTPDTQVSEWNLTESDRQQLGLPLPATVLPSAAPAQATP